MASQKFEIQNESVKHSRFNLNQVKHSRMSSGNVWQMSLFGVPCLDFSMYDQLNGL